MLRLAPWAAGWWLIAFLAMLVQPYCYALKVHAAGIAPHSAMSTGAQQGHEHGDCAMDQGLSHIGSDTTGPANRLELKSPPLMVASSLVPFGPSFRLAVRLARETGPPAQTAPLYLSTQRLRI